MLVRVAERRRAAQLARHYRDQEGLSIAEIARRLGRAEATIKTYLYDPTGDKARAVKARYRGVCRGCGAPTAPRNGKGDAYAYCKRCHPGAIAPRMDTGTGSRSDARVASALRRCAVLVRLVAHARTPARRRSAQTTTGRRMARTVHRHRSVRQLGGGPRRRLRRRLNARATVPLLHPRLRLVICERGRRRSPHTPRPFVSAAATRASALGDCWAKGSDSEVCLPVAADRAAGKHLDDSRKRGKGGPPTEPDGRARRHAHLWRQARLLRFRPRDPQSLKAGARRSPVPAP